MKTSRINPENLIKENKRRRDKLFEAYDPVLGIGSHLDRIRIAFTIRTIAIEAFYTIEMLEKSPVLHMLQEEGSAEEVFKRLGNDPTEDRLDEFMTGLTQDRLKYDFEYWAISAVTIQDKETKKEFAFRLRRPQRILLARLEKMRIAGEPIRVIIVKARQWGGSTLVQMYMAWIQLMHRLNWHSVIVADVEDQARNIRSMYSRFAQFYPKELGTVTLKNFEGSAKNKKMIERGCVISMGSMQKPDTLRSNDFAMCHLSEVGLWKKTEGKSPEDLMQSLRAAVSEGAYSMVVLESTAKGIGNFFYYEWLAAINGKSGYAPVFISWWDVEKYTRPIKDLQKFIEWMFKDEYAMFLWETGATLEGINWYFYHKAKENYDDWRMQSEYPSNWLEAFQSTGRRFYPPRYVSSARQTCMDPELIGEIHADAMRGPESLKNISFEEQKKGGLWIWSLPDHSINVSNRYAVFVDIGGTTDSADWSVIKVIDRYWMIDGEAPEIVATWRGHIDQDLVAWKAAQIGTFYNKALVAVETNSLNTDADTEGSHFLTILDEIVDDYDNLYMREDPDKVRQGLPAKYGFHTNVHTKSMLLNRHKAALREEEYIERDSRACDEMDSFEVKPNGKLGAVDGGHDDNVIVTAGVVWLALNYMPFPVVIVKSKSRVVKKVVGESTF